MRKFFGFVILLFCFGYTSVSVNFSSDFLSKKTEFITPAASGDFKSDFETARDHINNGLYQEALPILLRLIKDDAGNYNLNFLIGYCYYNSEAEKNKALPYLEKAVVSTIADYNDNSAKERNAPVYAFFYLGATYHKLGKLDEALFNLEKFRSFLVSKTGKLINQKNFDIFNEVNLKIAQVKTAKNLILAPLRIEFVRIPLVNAGNYSSYGAQLTKDNNGMYYSRERLNEKLRGRSDMFLLRRTGQNWVRNEQAGQNLNGPYNDIFNSISPDGKFLLFSSDRKGVFNIFYSMMDNNKWSEPFDNLSINSNFNETYAVLSSDGSKIIFVSDRPGGFGGKDLYKTEKKADGSWTQPENMGFTLNTPFDEDAPYLSPDGNTLYFSSEGHSSMGGSDVFYSLFKNNMWLEPVNMGYPINSVSNDVYFKWFPENNLLTLSSNRKGGGNNYEILGARYIDSTRTGEVFMRITDVAAEDTSEALPEKIIAETPVSPVVKEAVKEETAELKDDYLSEKEIVQPGIKALADSIAKARQKKVSDSLTAVRIAQAKEEMSKKRQQDQAAASKVRQDSLAAAKERERKLAIQKAAAEKLRVAQLEKEKARKDSIAYAVKLEEENAILAEQKLAAEKKAEQNLAEENQAVKKQAEQQQAAEKLAAGEKAEQQQLLEKLVPGKEVVTKPEEKVVSDTEGQARLLQLETKYKRKVDSLLALKKQAEDALARCMEKEKEKSKLIVERQDKPDPMTATEKTGPLVTKPSRQSVKSSQPAGEEFPPCDPLTEDSRKIYTVQVGAGWMKIKYFSSIQDKRICYGPDGMARFIVGAFSSLDEAEEMADNLRMLGFSDAWIPELDDKRCKCSENELLVRANVLDEITPAGSGENTPRYTVQVGAGNMKVKYFKNLRQVRVCTGTDGMSRFIFGEFSNLDEATLVKDKIMKMGYWDAWIPLIDENRCGSSP